MNSSKKYGAAGHYFHSCVNKETTDHYSQSRAANKNPRIINSHRRVSMSVFRDRILWRFSLSKNYISPAAPDLELILFPLWYWPIRNAHTKQQDKVFETDFIDSQKSDPPFANLLALRHIYILFFLNIFFIGIINNYMLRVGL